MIWQAKTSGFDQTITSRLPTSRSRFKCAPVTLTISLAHETPQHEQVQNDGWCLLNSLLGHIIHCVIIRYYLSFLFIIHSKKLSRSVQNLTTEVIIHLSTHFSKSWWNEFFTFTRNPRSVPKFLQYKFHLESICCLRQAPFIGMV